MPNSVPSENLAAIILSGGNSVRMGFDKSQLKLGDGTTFMEQIIRTLQPQVGCIVVVQNQDRKIKSNPQVIVTSDRQPNLGPMEGIASGLSVLPEQVELAFVTSCDVPLIRAEVIDQLFNSLEDYDGVTPVDGDRIYGLTAIYRKSVLSTLDTLIEQRMLKVSQLCDHLRIRQVPIELIRAVDPFLESLTNVNSLSDYEKLAANLNFEVDQNWIEEISR